MPDPTTTLDPRFSEPGAAPVSWEETRRILEQAQLSWISTVRADGRPHVTPLPAVWLDGAAHFATGPGEQKAVNLRATPYVVITTGCSTWDRGYDVMVEGTAVRVTDGAALGRLAEAWGRIWDGRWTYDVRDGAFRDGDGTAIVFRVEPAKILVFGKGTFTQTRHRF